MTTPPRRVATTASPLQRPEDRAFFERELAGFLPDRVFDAHCHLWLPEDVPFKLPGYERGVGAADYMALLADLHPGREYAALFLSFGMPDRPGSRDRMNAFIAAQTALDPRYRGAFFVQPDDDPEWVRQEVRRLGLHGLKCYHTYAASQPTWQANIETFLPESLVRLAHEESWTITLHIVKSRAIADRENLECIARYCRKYPNQKLILAHSARGFQPAHNLEGLPALRGLDNLWFDTSANCEPIAHQAILRILGHERLMYGSDLPISHFRGRSLSAGDSFLWLYEQTPVWGERHSKIDPVLIGLEHLRSVKWACWSERLSDSQIEDVFWNNAAKLFHVT